MGVGGAGSIQIFGEGKTPEIVLWEKPQPLQMNLTKK